MTLGIRQAGVIHQYIDGAEACNHCVEQRIDLSRIGDIGGVRDSPCRLQHRSLLLTAAPAASTSFTTTCAPSVPKRSAIARPIPVRGPVTSATRPAMCWGMTTATFSIDVPFDIFIKYKREAG
ncbi:MAG: hypothetical protein U0074_11730 [Kouleothrix sp.]